MPTFPFVTGIANGPVIHPYTFDSIGIQLALTGLTLVDPTSGTITEDKIFYVPFVIVNKPYTAVQMFTYNGTVVGGLTDIGIYDSQGNRLVSSTPTTQAGTSVIQFFNITDTTMNPGLYWMAMVNDTATATFFRNATVSQQLQRGAYVREQLATTTLPATATFSATPTTTPIPCFGLTNRTF